MEGSILDDVKKILGLSSDYDAFDLDIITHINSVFSTLQQLGIGPEQGFSISDKNNNWDEFVANDNGYNLVKTYMYLRVRLLFDPPATSFHLESLTQQLKELEWRLNAYREDSQWALHLPSHLL